MPFDLVTWALGYVFNSVTNRVTKPFASPSLPSALRKTVTTWADALPDEIKIAPEAMFTNVLADTDANDRPALRTIRRTLRETVIPTTEQWTDALIENWSDKRTNLKRHAHEFFLLPPDKAKEHLTKLGQLLHQACAENDILFRNTITQQVHYLTEAQSQRATSTATPQPIQDAAFVQAALMDLPLHELQSRVIEPWLNASGYKRIEDASSVFPRSDTRVLLARKEELGEWHLRTVVAQRTVSPLDDDFLSFLQMLALKLFEFHDGAASRTEEVLLVTPSSVASTISERFPVSAANEQKTFYTTIRLVDGVRLARAIIADVPTALLALSDQLRRRLAMLEEQNEITELSQYGTTPRLADIFIESDYGVFRNLQLLISKVLVTPGPQDPDYSSKILPLSSSELEELSRTLEVRAPHLGDLSELLRYLALTTRVLMPRITALANPHLPSGDVDITCNRLASFQRVIDNLARLAFLERRGAILDRHEYSDAEAFLAEVESMRRIATYRHIIHLKGVCLVIGNAGAGKTTLLKTLYRKWEDNKSSSAIMLRAVDVQELHEEGVLEAFRLRFNSVFTNKYDKAAFSLCCAEGRVAFLLDGLDEAGQRARILIESLRRINSKYPTCPMIISCRPAVDLGTWDAIRIELCEFTESQLRTFIAKWFVSKPSTAQSLLSALERATAIKRLATSPLMAALLCLIYNDTAEVPDSERSLHEERLALLLGKWEKGKGIPTMTQEAQRRYLFFLRRLAFLVHSDEVREVSPARALSVVKDYFVFGYNKSTESMLSDCISRTLLFIGPEGGLGFGHLTNQEFLCAQELAHFHREDFVAAKLGEPWWENVLRYYAAIVGNIESLFRRLSLSDRRRHQLQLRELNAVVLLPFNLDL
jgi:hypothetical protein